MRRERADVAVVGAGPAGLSAAIEAARSGLDVVVIDENPAAGGQIFRQLPASFSATAPHKLGRDHARGQQLLSDALSLPIRFFLETTVWGCFEQHVLELSTAESAFQLGARAVVVAAGAHDRPVPLPGWTLPGVLTIGGVQLLLKSQRLLAGRRFLLAGTGPLLLVVASQLAEAGADIAAVVEPVPTRALVGHAAALLRAPSLMRDGLVYRFNLLRRGIPWIAPAVLLRIDGGQEVERATIVEADEDWRPRPGTERSFDVDTVCVGYGLVPSVELLRLCGCVLRYDTLADAWVPERSADFETSVPGIYAVGDGARVAGAVVAADEGRVAGLAAAQALRALSPVDAVLRAAPARQRLARLASFRQAMDAAFRIRPGLHELAEAETVVCRCEEVRVRDVTAAIHDGARALNQVKCWTRAGMGPCQSRMCAVPTAHIFARGTGMAIPALGSYTTRPPIKPIPVAALLHES